jgi:CheY-like chemotaxis protein
VLRHVRRDTPGSVKDRILALPEGQPFLGSSTEVGGPHRPRTDDRGDSLPDFEVVGTATDGEAGVCEVVLTRPDVGVLMDIRMPGVSPPAGLRAADTGRSMRVEAFDRVRFSRERRLWRDVMRPIVRTRPKPTSPIVRRTARRRALLLAAAMSLAVAGSPGWSRAGVTQTPQLLMPDSGCAVQILELTGLTATSRTTVTAMSDSGFVVGTSREDGAPAAAVVWTSPDQVINTGVGGFVLADGDAFDATAVDVNEAGLVAINRTRYNAQGLAANHAAVLWSHSSGASVLPAPSFRPRAAVAAINDHGDVVGRIWGKGHGSVPVVWRDGRRFRLPHSSRSVLFATDINNDGMVVGTAHDVRGSAPWASWWWRSGTRIRPLTTPDDTVEVLASEVDDSGRIVGRQRVGPGDSVRTVLWRNRDAPPRRVMRLETLDLHGSGYVAATEPGFRGQGATAYVGRLRDGSRAQLPAPTEAGEPVAWSNLRASAVARGSSSFSPQGGVTIGGHAQDSDGVWMSRALLWTCAQTLINRK